MCDVAGVVGEKRASEAFFRNCAAEGRWTGVYNLNDLNQGGILFFNRRLIFHILDVENEPRKTSVPSYVE